MKSCTRLGTQPQPYISLLYKMTKHLSPNIEHPVSIVAMSIIAVGNVWMEFLIEMALLRILENEILHHIMYFKTQDLFVLCKCLQFRYC